MKRSSEEWKKGGMKTLSVCLIKEKGIEKGIEKGKNERRKEDIKRMLSKGKSVEQIVDFCGYDRAEVEAVQLGERGL